MTRREQFIHAIEAFCRAKSLSEREFSEIAVQNPKFMVRLRRNIVSSRNMDKADLFLISHANTDPASLKDRVEARRGAGRLTETQAAA